MRTLLILFFIALNVYASAQDTITLSTSLRNEDTLFRYKKKKFTGVGITKYENGNLESITEFRKGLLNGNYKYYYENGQLKLSILFENNQRVGKSFSYFENGQLYIEESYENGLPEGEAIIYDENGEMKTKINFKKGVLDGLYTEFYDGDPYSGMMINGKREGEWICYDKDSNILILHQYKNDIEIPITREIYYENGQLERVFSFLGEKNVGEWKYYYENGQIKLIQNWNDGLRDGESILYDEAGNIIGKKIYSKGETISCEGKCD